MLQLKRKGDLRPGRVVSQAVGRVMGEVGVSVSLVIVGACGSPWSLEGIFGQRRTSTGRVAETRLT